MQMAACERVSHAPTTSFLSLDASRLSLLLPLNSASSPYASFPYKRRVSDIPSSWPDVSGKATDGGVCRRPWYFTAVRSEHPGTPLYFLFSTKWPPPRWEMKNAQKVILSIAFANNIDAEYFKDNIFCYYLTCNLRFTVLSIRRQKCQNSANLGAKRY